jgi:hypothetical protein
MKRRCKCNRKIHRSCKGNAKHVVRHDRHVERDLGIGDGQGRLATGRGVSRTVAHVPPVPLAEVSTAESW